MLASPARHWACRYLRSAGTGARWPFDIPMDGLGRQNRWRIGDRRDGEMFGGQAGPCQLRRYCGRWKRVVGKDWCGVTRISKGKIKDGISRGSWSKTLRDVGILYWRGFANAGEVKHRDDVGRCSAAGRLRCCDVDENIRWRLERRSRTAFLARKSRFSVAERSCG